MPQWLRPVQQQFTVFQVLWNQQDIFEVTKIRALPPALVTMPLALLSDEHLPILEVLSPSSLRSLLATNRQLRRQVHAYVTRLQIHQRQDVPLLARHDWPSLTT